MISEIDKRTPGTSGPEMETEQLNRVPRLPQPLLGTKYILPPLGDHVNRA